MAENHIPGVLMLDIQGQHLSQEECRLLSRQSVGGVILFSRNYTEPKQLRELIAEIRECKPEMLLAVDQEGGRVQRFRSGFSRLPGDFVGVAAPHAGRRLLCAAPSAVYLVVRVRLESSTTTTAKPASSQQRTPATRI